MSVYLENNLCRLDKGNRKPANLYYGSKKITGYQTNTSTEKSITFENGYNDRIKLKASGSSVQASNEASSNLFNAELINTNLINSNGTIPTTSRTYSENGTVYSNVGMSQIYAQGISLNLKAGTYYLSMISSLIPISSINETINTRISRCLVFTNGTYSIDLRFETEELTKATRTLTIDEDSEIIIVFGINGYTEEDNPAIFKNVLLSTTETDYEPYYPASPSPEAPSEIVSLENFEVGVRGKNLFDKNNINLLDNIAFLPTGLVRSNGSKCFYIPIEKAKTYTATKIVSTANKRFSLATYDEIPELGSIPIDTITDNFSTTLSLTNTNGNYLLIYLYYLTTEPSFDEIIEELLVSDNGATDYEPYVEPVTTTIPTTLRSLPNSVKDELDNKSVVRNVKELILDGTESYWSSPNYGNSRIPFGIAISDILITSSDLTNCFCNYYRADNSNEYQLMAPTFRKSNGNSVIWFFEDKNIYNNDDTTLNLIQFKQWLAEKYAEGNPVIVQYELAEPTTETIEYDKVPTYYGTNIVEITSNIDFESEMQYKTPSA